MDDRLRALERRAKAGDIVAAQQWLRETSRADDYIGSYEAIMLIFEHQYPGMLKQLQQIDAILSDSIERLARPQVDEPGSANRFRFARYDQTTDTP